MEPENRDFTADLCVGLLYTILSVILLITYIPTLVMLGRDKSAMKRSCYKIMFSMGIADILQLIGIGFVGGIFTLTNSTYNDLCNRVWGSIINVCWLINCLQGNILAFNRCINLYSQSAYSVLFNGKRTFFWILAAAVYGLGINAMYVSQSADLIYATNNYIWYYNITNANRFCLITEISQDYVNEGMSLIFVVLIALKLKKMRSATTANKLSEKDKSAIYQAIWLSISLMVYNTVYFCVVNVTTNKWAILVGNLLWILVNGQTPTVMMVFNRNLRLEILKMLGIHSAIVRPLEPTSLRLVTVQQNHNN